MTTYMHTCQRGDKEMCARLQIQFTRILINRIRTFMDVHVCVCVVCGSNVMSLSFRTHKADQTRLKPNLSKTAANNPHWQRFNKFKPLK